MKLLFSSAVFVAIMASASSIEEKASKGLMNRKVVNLNSNRPLKPVQKAIVEEDEQEYGRMSDFLATMSMPTSPPTKKEDDDDDKKSKDDDDDDDKKSKDDDDDDDDKKNKDDDDDDDKDGRVMILPVCEVDGENYQRCAPLTIHLEDVDTCDLIAVEVCEEDKDTFDAEYCECLGIEYEKKVVQGSSAAANKENVLKGLVARKVVNLNSARPLKQVQKETIDEDEQEFGRMNDFLTTMSMPTPPPTKDDDDDKKSKDDDDDDDKKSKDDDDDDDDKKNKDDDDDDDKDGRVMVLPVCEVDGENYHRCDQDTVLEEDIDTCDLIAVEVCEEDRDTFDAEYCECIGIEYEKRVIQLRGAISAQLN